MSALFITCVPIFVRDWKREKIAMMKMTIQ